MQRSNYRIVSGVVFAIIAAAQVLRAAMAVHVQAGDFTVPVWLSWIAALAAAAMSFWALRGRS
ncbi:MAG: hypothetical protein K8S99_04385 [Planctomycetes bacterium]|nr:hypothetical protein [Planctomycetota bacterium]